MQYCPILCLVFCLFILLMDDLTETFATAAKNSSMYTGNLSSMYTGNLIKSFFQTHTRSWKDYKKPLCLHRHRVKHSVFTSNLFEMQIVLQVGPSSSLTRLPTNLVSTPFFQLSLLKIPSCNFGPNQPSPFALIPYLRHKILSSALLLLPSEALPENRSFSVPIQIFHSP